MTAAAPVAEGRAAVLAAFARTGTLPQPATPSPRPAQRHADPISPENLSEEAVDELIAGWRAGNLAWPRRLLGEEPGHPDCRPSPSVLRRNGLALMFAPATTIILVVSPSPNVDGRKAYSTRGQLFDGKVDGRCIVERSTTPLCDAARVLLAEGVDPVTRVVMRHAGSLADALRSTVGTAAGLTVADDTGGKPVFRTWKPYDAGSAVAVASPMRETAPAATLLCSAWIHPQ